MVVERNETLEFEKGHCDEEAEEDNKDNFDLESPSGLEIITSQVNSKYCLTFVTYRREYQDEWTKVQQIQ